MQAEPEAVVQSAPGDDDASDPTDAADVNVDPTAVADTASTAEDSSVTIDVLANDTDPNASDTLSITNASITSGLGSVSIVGGQLQYDPGANYNSLADGESAAMV